MNDISVKDRLSLSQFLTIVYSAFVLLLSSPLAVGDDVVIFQDDTQQVILNPYVSYFEDVSAALTIDTIVNEKDHLFEPGREPGIAQDYGLTHSAIWQKVTISNQSAEEKRVVIRLMNPMIEYFEGYWIDGDVTTVRRGGNMVPLHERQIALHLTLFKYNIEPGKTYTLYTRATANFPLVTPLSLYEENYFRWHLHVLRLLEGLVVGIVIALFFYNVYIAFRQPTPSTIYFNLYLLSTLIYVSVATGYSIYFWPKHVFFNYYMNNISGSLVVIFISLYMTSFLELEQSIPWADKFIRWVVKFQVFINIPMSFTGAYQIIIPVAASVGGLLILLVLYAAYKMMRKGFRPAKYFAISILPLCIAGAELILSYAAVIERSEYVETHIFLAMAVQLMLLSIGMADKINWVAEEKAEAEKFIKASEAQRKGKSQSLAQLSHEIRTPMTGIVSMGALLKRQSDLTLIQQFHTSMMIKGGRQLLHTINNVLDFSKLEAGKVVTETVEFEVDEAVQDSLKTFVDDMESKGVDLIYTIDSSVPMVALGDSQRIQQIVHQLVHNSWSHTKSGWVHVHLSYLGSRLVVRVVDTGTGISESDIRLMSGDSFSLVPISVDSGLGISIVKGLLELLDGEFSIESNEGVGTEVVCRIPLEISPKALAYRNRESSAISVAVGSHSPDVAESVFDLFRLFNATIQVFAEGERLIEALAEQASGDPFDIVVLDTQLRDMNGFNCAREIANRFSAVDPLTIPILLRANPNKYEMSQVRQYGFTGILSKLSTRKNVMDAYEFWQSEAIQSVGRSQREASTIAGAKTLQILVAEDNPVNQMVVKQLLERSGHHVLVVDNGEAAVEKYQQSAEDIDLILMDCEMPIMDGIAATHAIRIYELENNLRRAPISALTAHQIDNFSETLAQDGFDDALMKPVTEDKLSKLIGKIL